MDLLVSRTRDIRAATPHPRSGSTRPASSSSKNTTRWRLIGKAGLGTPHMDGNTRLCTATAAAALKQTFGCDGQPGSYDDIDVTDCLLHVGHNMAHTDTVLWMRVLDRRRGPEPAGDGRHRPPGDADGEGGRRAPDAAQSGTNAAVLNGLNNLLIEGGYADRRSSKRIPSAMPNFKKRVSSYSPERVEEMSGVPAADLRRAGRAHRRRPRACCRAACKGVYQSKQGCASAVQVNNVNLILGQDRPAGVRHSADERPAHRAEHARDRGRRRHVRVPQLDQPRAHRRARRHVERRLATSSRTGSARRTRCRSSAIARSARSACSGSRAPTRPSRCPMSRRIREILAKEDLFVVVSDAFLTETADLADLVLPTALWGEKTGCTTNVSRTVHITHKAVEPPGEARSDLDIFLDFSRRMDFRDKDGQPLIKWSDAEGAFKGWRECTQGRPCDYTGLSYAQARSEGSGMPWPCNEEHPDGQPSASTRTCTSRPMPSIAKATARTSTPARRSTARSTGPQTRRDARSSSRSTTGRRPSSPTTPTRSC